MRIYVGNLSYDTTESGLSEQFGQHGTVDEVAVLTDRETGRSRGFGFVTMSDDGEAQAAIDALDGVEFEGRTLKVNQARPRTGGGDEGRGGRRDSW